jgi:hypothetical protein
MNSLKVGKNGIFSTGGGRTRCRKDDDESLILIDSDLKLLADGTNKESSS